MIILQGPFFEFRDAHRPAKFNLLCFYGERVSLSSATMKSFLCRVNIYLWRNRGAEEQCSTGEICLTFFFLRFCSVGMFSWDVWTQGQVREVCYTDNTFVTEEFSKAGSPGNKSATPDSGARCNQDVGCVNSWVWGQEEIMTETKIKKIEVR